jgi:Tol biopolymer transport system component
LAVVVAAIVSATTTALAQTTTRVDLASDGTPADAGCHDVAVSGDGNFVAFVSRATNLAPVDATPNDDVFVLDRTTGAITLESVASDGTEADQNCAHPRLSSDGRWLAFESVALDLVAGSQSYYSQIYLRDRVAGTTIRVSQATDGSCANSDCALDAISRDGRFVIYETEAGNIVVQSGASTGYFDVFLYDSTTGTNEIASVANDGSWGNHHSRRGDVSDDGRYVAFDSLASNLVGDPHDNHQIDVFVRDRVAATTIRVTYQYDGADTSSDSFGPRISGDGSYVVFQSDDPRLVRVDGPHRDVFLWDRNSGTIELETVTTDGRLGDDDSNWPAVSSDGRFVAFASYANDFSDVDLYNRQNVFVRDRLRGTLEAVTADDNGFAGDGASSPPSISTDGRLIGFDSLADNLVSGDTPNTDDAFVREWCRVQAAWSNYGSGYPGRNGVVPTLVAEEPPRIGTTLSLDMSNSSNTWTFGFLLAGFDKIDAPTSLGGDLLVTPVWIVAVPLPPTGYTLDQDLDYDQSLGGVVLYAQLLEFDPWAKHGVSFTDGLELDLGF